MMTGNRSRLFAVIPAAGLSRRMGQPKLLLPLHGSNVITRLLDAINHQEILARCVVVRQSDAPLRAAVEAANAWCVSPDINPADMRRSVEFGLSEIARRFMPRDDDGWILVPADFPALSKEVVRTLVEAWSRRRSTILIPRFGERRGHPAVFRWSLAKEVAKIPVDRGLNWLVEQHASEVDEISVNQQGVLIDMDTVEDYEKLRQDPQEHPPSK